MPNIVMSKELQLRLQKHNFMQTLCLLCEKVCAATLQKVQDDLQTIFERAATRVNRAHNLQIVQVQLQKCNYFTNSAILIKKMQEKLHFSAILKIS